MNSDTELATKARKGDAEAFEALVRRYARLVWATVAGMIADPSWTEDLVQETFLRAWKSVDQLEDAAAFRPWVLSIARRLVFRHTELSRRPLPDVDEVEPQPKSLDVEEARRRVQAALQRLPERYRLPLALRYLNDMDYGRISRELELSNGALRGLLNRGVKMLRRELTPFWKAQEEL